ncbi:2-keto-myo-inositol isomerase [Pricia antarctica]|uniref:2-keto-myo-inositol isomerase n=1 Tax=Pricia antarctica TaxID=641691 RepID=A0A1G7AM28_9FLAO|nr:sugar phosphate isomerase/epimerase [Pricia antarctica]SDE15938.1 2-keto-myo-inositol isomerase [Pricia antarctica]
MPNKITRRKALTTSVKASMAAMFGYAFAPISQPTTGHKTDTNLKLPFRISLNTSTISAYKLPVDQQIDKVATAGFDGIELWMSDVKAYLEKGGTTIALKKKLQAGNLILEDMIGFSPWCSDNLGERKKAVAQLREEMLLTAELGGKYIAAPILSLKTLDRTKFDAYTERYAAILDLAADTSVTPLLELWGMGALHNLGDCAKIAIDTGHPNAAILLDFYHIYRGGNAWETLDILNGSRLPVIHMNDYPATPSREKLTDADRVLPGEGICPFNEILPKLYASGFSGGLSVELFNKGYWASMDVDTLLKMSYESTFTIVKEIVDDHG